jgi:hypothetical protein
MELRSHPNESGVVRHNDIWLTAELWASNELRDRLFPGIGCCSLTKARPSGGEISFLQPLTDKDGVGVRRIPRCLAKHRIGNDKVIVWAEQRI